MNTRFYIIIAVTIIGIGAAVTLISTRKSPNKFPLNKGGKRVVNSTLIQTALETGNYAKLLDLGIIDKIPTTEKEIAALNSKLKKIIRDRSNYAKSGGQTTEDRRRKTEDVGSTNQSPQNFNNTEEISEGFPLNKGGNGVVNTNTTDKTVATSKPPNLSTSPDQVASSIDEALQAALLQQSVQPDDIVLNLEKVNSDYIDAIATNNGAVWLMGLTSPQYELSLDYRDRLFEIPGVGFYLLPKNVAPNSEDFINEKLQVLNEALSLKPDSLKLVRALALTYAGEAGNLDKALATLDKFIENSDDNIDVSFQKAEILRAASENPNYSDDREKLLEKALHNYEKTVNNSREPDAVVKSAIAAEKILSKRGESEKGITILEDAYRNIDGDINYHNKLKVIRKIGDHYYKEGNYYEALDWYDRENVEYWAFEYAKGNIYSKLNDDYNALQSYKKSVKYNPGQPGPSIKLISTYAKNGEIYKAKQELKRFNNYLNKNSKKTRKSIKNSSSYKKAIKLIKK